MVTNAAPALPKVQVWRICFSADIAKHPEKLVRVLSMFEAGIGRAEKIDPLTAKVFSNIRRIQHNVVAD